MSLEPGSRPRDVAAETRDSARRGAQHVAGWGPILAGVLIVAFLMTVFLVLDYGLDQDPHRIIKVAVGALAMGSLVLWTRVGLVLLPIVTPFLGWVPPTPIPGLNALNVILFSVFGRYAYERILQRKPVLKLGRLGPLILILLGLAALSIVRGAAFPTGYGYNPVLAFNLEIRAAATFMTYFIVVSVANGEKDRRLLTWAVLAGLALESLTVIAYGRNGPGGRAIGSIGQANELGAYLTMFTLVAAALAVGARSWYAKLVAAAVFFLGSFGVIMSLSRGSMLALVGGVMYVLWRSARWALVVVVIALASAPFWAPDYLVDRIKGSKVESEEAGVSVDNASEVRLMTWRAIIEVITHHPIDGVGFTGLSAVLPDVGAELGLTDIKDSAHNTYLRMLSELGIGGLVVFVMLLWRTFALTLKAAKVAKRRFDRAIALGMGGAVASMAVSCAFGDRFWSPVVVSSFWVMAALVEDSIDHPAPGGGR